MITHDANLQVDGDSAVLIIIENTKMFRNFKY